MHGASERRVFPTVREVRGLQRLGMQLEPALQIRNILPAV